MIDKKPLAQRELARKVLLFIAYARGPVSIDILTLAVAVKDHTQSLDILRSSVSAEKIILNSCGNLLSIDDTDPNIRRVCFIHFSVHEFLTNHRLRLLHTIPFEYEVAEVAHREIAQMCMNFLLILYSQLQDYCTNIESSFAKYILTALPYHLLAGNLNSLDPGDKMIDLTLLFFGRGPPMLAESYDPRLTNTFFAFSPSVLALLFNLPGTHQHYDSRVVHAKRLDPIVLAWVHGRVNGFPAYFTQLCDDRLAVHYATGQLDSAAICQRLYMHGYPIEFTFRYSPEPLNICNPQGFGDVVPDFCTFTPLYLVQGEEVARFLLNSGASANPQVENRQLPNLLGYLTNRGDTKLIQLLLDHGAEQDEATRIRGLQTVAYKGNIEAIQLLLYNGVDVNAQDGDYGNALQAAASNGQVETMQFLLDEGADVNMQCGFYGNVLQAAASSGNIEAMKLLLNQGVNVNTQGGYYGNPLQAAAESDNVEAVMFLLKEGSDVHAQGGHYGNALQVAASKPNIEVMRLLLDKGADVNEQGGYYGNALQAAAGNIEAMQLLLDSGADFNVQGGLYGNVLQAAAYAGNIEAIQLLLNKRVDVNTQGGCFGNALQAAANYGNIEAIQLLLDAGADVNAQGGYYDNALQVAVCRGHVRVMRLLLDSGANVNANIRTDVDTYCEGYSNALQAAVSGKIIEAVQLLLDEGVDVNAHGGEYGHVLQAAAYNDNVQAVQLLIDKGANVHAQGGEYGNALQAAAFIGNIKIMRLLLDKGADVNAQGGLYGNALQAAHAYNVDVKPIKFLLDVGADVTAVRKLYSTTLFHHKLFQ